MAKSSSARQSRLKYIVTDELKQIYQATIKFLSPLNVSDSYKIITEEGKKLINAKFATIFIAKNKRLIRTYTSGPKIYKLKLRRNGYTYTAFNTGVPAVVTIDQYKKSHPEVHIGEIKTIFNVPLTNHGKTIGVLNLHSVNRYPRKGKTLEILMLFGSLASMAIRKADLYNEIKENLDARDLFVSMTAHELRTPLTAISGYAQLFNQKLAKGEVPPKKWAEILEYETLRLRRLVNELLQIDQIAYGEFIYNFQPLNIIDVIRQAIRDIKFKYPNHKVIIVNKINSDIDIVSGDYDKLLQVFINVINNAAKFSQIKKEINITVDGSRKKYVTISVRDFGKGISTKDKKRIFEKFYKGSNTKSEGIGIGLYISKRIIGDHSGIIKINSKVDQGTIVEVRLLKLDYK